MAAKVTHNDYKEVDPNARQPKFKITDDVRYRTSAVKHVVRGVEPRGDSFAYTIENGHKIMEEDLQSYTLQRGWI